MNIDREKFEKFKREVGKENIDSFLKTYLHFMSTQGDMKANALLHYNNAFDKMTNKIMKPFENVTDKEVIDAVNNFMENLESMVDDFISDFM